MKTPEPLNEIEKLLGAMVPAAPDATLMARLQGARPNVSSKMFPRWIPLAVAACFAAILGLAVLYRREPISPVAATGNSAKPVNSPAPALIPIESREHLMGVTDFGIVHDCNDRPVRLIATTWLDEMVYSTESTGDRVTHSRVRQEVMPVSLQTY
jgi:hypothetical protein